MEQLEKVIALGQNLSLYQDSEKSEQGLEEDVLDEVLDALWQSIYDVCKLADFGIVEDVEEIEIKEAELWLKTYQSLTKRYKEVSIGWEK